jgi:hypothetical protein
MKISNIKWPPAPLTVTELMWELTELRIENKRLKREKEEAREALIATESRENDLIDRLRGGL